MMHVGVLDRSQFVGGLGRNPGEQLGSGAGGCGQHDGVESLAVDAPPTVVGFDGGRGDAGTNRAASGADVVGGSLGQRRHAGSRRREDRAVGRGRGTSSAAAGHEQASVRLGELSELRHGREARVVGVGGVDAADEGIDEPFVHLVAEPLSYECTEVVVGRSPGEQRLGRRARTCHASSAARW